MRRLPVDSTSLASIGYDAATATLEVEFRHGGVYRYFLVPASVYRALIDAESKGRFLNEAIKERYPYERVE